MTKNQNRGVRRGWLGHSFNLPYSLELFLDFWKKSFFRSKPGLKFAGLTIWGCFPTSDDCLQASWQGPSFSRKTRHWNFRPHLGDFRIFWIQQRRGISPEVGSTNFQPVMFDMDPFGGKKVPCTKYRESGIYIWSFLNLFWHVQPKRNIRRMSRIWYGLDKFHGSHNFDIKCG